MGYKRSVVQILSPGPVQGAVAPSKMFCAHRTWRGTDSACSLVVTIAAVTLAARASRAVSSGPVRLLARIQHEQGRAYLQYVGERPRFCSGLSPYGDGRPGRDARDRCDRWRPARGRPVKARCPVAPRPCSARIRMSEAIIICGAIMRGSIM